MSATSQTSGERQSVAGRAIFACFAFGSGLAVLALLERMGVAAPVVRSLLLFGVLGGIAAITVLQRSTRISAFYAGGRQMTGVYAGLALVGLTAAVALPLLSGREPLPRPTLGAGLLLGGICAGLLTGPLLRKTGAFSIPDLLAARFPGLPLRLSVVAVAASIAACVGLAGFDASLVAVSDAVGLARWPGTAILAALLALAVVPGGLQGTAWAAFAGAVVLFAALAAPIVPFGGSATPLADVLARLAAAGQGLVQWEAVPQRLAGLDPVACAALVLGVGTLVPLLGPAIACRDTAGAQSAGRRAAVFGLILIALGAGFVRAAVPQTGIVLPALALTAAAAIELALAAAAVQAFAAMLGHDVVHRLRDATALSSRRLAITRGFAIAAIVAAAVAVGAGRLDPVVLLGVAIWLSAALIAPLLALALWPRAGTRDAAVALLTAGGAALAALFADTPEFSAPRLALSAVVGCGMGLVAGLALSTLRRDARPEGAEFVRSVLRDPVEFPQLDRGA